MLSFRYHYNMPDAQAQSDFTFGTQPVDLS